MNYQEFYQILLTGESKEDWCYHETQILDIPEHFNEIAVLKNNLKISIRMGRLVNDNFVESWTEGYPDPTTRSYWVGLYYNENLIKKESIVYIDGGRGAILLPEKKIENDKIVYYYSKERYKLAKILDNLFGTISSYHSLDEVIKNKGIELNKD